MLGFGSTILSSPVLRVARGACPATQQPRVSPVTAPLLGTVLCFLAFDRLDGLNAARGPGEPDPSGAVARDFGVAPSTQCSSTHHLREKGMKMVRASSFLWGKELLKVQVFT